MKIAFFQFINWKSTNQKRTDYIINSFVYENLKREFSEQVSRRMKGRIPTEYEREKSSIRMKNRIVSEETRRKNSITRKTNPKLIELSIKNLPPPKFGKDNPFYGKKHTKETIQKISESQKGIPLHIKVGIERSIEIRRKMSEGNSGKRWWNNGEKCIFSSEKPDENWNLGRLNKGNLGRKKKI